MNKRDTLLDVAVIVLITVLIVEVIIIGSMQLIIHIDDVRQQKDRQLITELITEPVETEDVEIEVQGKRQLQEKAVVSEPIKKPVPITPPPAPEHLSYLGKFKLTAYCACAKCCGKSNGITASGTRATEGRTIAVDTRVIPFGTKVEIEGIGTRVAEDRGGSIKENKIDVYFISHSDALKFGVQYRNVYIINNAT